MYADPSLGPPQSVSISKPQTTPVAGTARPWKGPVLLVGFLAVVVASTWIQRNVTAECRRARVHAAGTAQAALDSPHLLRFLSLMYSVGLRPPVAHVQRERDFATARTGFNDTMEVLRKDFGDLAPTEDLNLLETSAGHLVAEIEQLFAEVRPDSPKLPPIQFRRRAIDDQFREAELHYERLESRVGQIARAAGLEYARAQDRADRTELFVLAMLLGVVGVSALLLWRLAWRVRIEMKQKDVRQRDRGLFPDDSRWPIHHRKQGPRPDVRLQVAGESHRGRIRSFGPAFLRPRAARSLSQGDRGG